MTSESRFITDSGDMPVRRILIRRAGPLLKPQPAPNNPRTFLDDVKGFIGAQAVIKTSPGSGKSRDASEFVTQAWQQGGEKGLYLMLSHQAIEERQGKIDQDGSGAIWEHWRPHDDTCERKRQNEKGYRRVGECTCKRGNLKASGPTLAPIDYIFAGLPNSTEPLIEEVHEFDYWVIDEMDFRRLLGFREASANDIIKMASLHPDNSIKMLCMALREIIGPGVGQRLNGYSFYDALDSALKGKGTNLVELSQTLTCANLELQPGLFDRNLPVNFPPALVPVLLREVEEWQAKRHFNPCIHLISDEERAKLHIWWRKDLREDDYQPNFFILDATADPSLLRLVFGDDIQSEELEVPSWPDNVHVHQWVDDVVTAGTLGIEFQGSPFSAKNKASRNRWYQRIDDNTKDLSRDCSVGIVTHMKIENEAKVAIEKLGFADVRTLHYGAERGSNLLEDVNVLILLGLPIPNPRGFEEEAQAYLWDQGDLDFEWREEERKLEMTEGSAVPVRTKGYWNGLVGAYYRQKCQAGLYQALHRIRPYIAKDERHLFVFTNMPIDGVKVQHVMRSEVRERITNRWDSAVSEIERLLVINGVCTVAELAKALVASRDSEASMRKWLTNNGRALADITGSVYEVGNGRRSGRFVRQGHISI